MRSLRGFTLIELMLALTITGVVALLVYGAADIAFDTQARLTESEHVIRSEHAWHTVIEDALRNLRANADYPRATLLLTPGLDAAGRPHDRLEFITAGGTPPLTGDADWIVTVEIGESGPVLTALPIGVRVPARRIVGLPGIRGLDIRVLSGIQNSQWLDQWNNRQQLPRAIELTYWTDDGPVSPSVLLTLPGGATP